MSGPRRPQRTVYRSAAAYWLNAVVFPLKMVVPQPIIARIPGLTTNTDIRTGLVLDQARGRLLDVGCGPNLLVKAFRAKGGDGVGVDVYPWEGVDQLVEDTSRLPFEERSFDTITFVACLNHIPNRREALTEAVRLLRPGGRIVITNLRPLVSRVWHWFAFWDQDQKERGMREGEVWGFTRGQMIGMVNGAGLQVTRFFSFSWGLNQLYVCGRKDDRPD